MVDYFNQEKLAGRIAPGHMGTTVTFWKAAKEGGLLPARTGSGMQYGHFLFFKFSINFKFLNDSLPRGSFFKWQKRSSKVLKRIFYLLISFSKFSLNVETVVVGLLTEPRAASSSTPITKGEN